MTMVMAEDAGREVMVSNNNGASCQEDVREGPIEHTRVMVGAHHLQLCVKWTSISLYYIQQAQKRTRPFQQQAVRI